MNNEKSFVSTLFYCLMFYAGVYFVVFGIWPIAHGYVSWKILHLAQPAQDPLIVIVFFVLIYGSEMISGLLLMVNAKWLGRWGVRRIPGTKPAEEMKWDDASVFATVVAMILGFYFISRGLDSLGYSWYSAMLMTGFDGFSMPRVLNYIKQEWTFALYPLFNLIPGLFLVVGCGRVASIVVRFSSTNKTDNREEEP